MRFVTFRLGDDRSRAGLMVGDLVVDIASVDASLPSTVLGLVIGGDAVTDRLRSIVDDVGGAGEDALDAPHGSSPAVHRPADLRLLAPIPDPPRLRDYVTFEAHVAGSGFEVPTAMRQMPSCYKGNHLAIAGHGDVVPWPAYTRQLDFEAEVGFFVGREVRDVSPQDAHAAIAGVALFNDISARDIQLHEMTSQLGPAKGKDFCNVIGPVLVTIDEIDDEYGIEIDVVVDGETWSCGTTDGRLFSMAEVLSWASWGETVHPGEFLGLGTVAGGSGLELGRWIAPGQTIELRSPQLGVLRNVIGEPESTDQASVLRSFRAPPLVGAP